MQRGSTGHMLFVIAAGVVSLAVCALVGGMLLSFATTFLGKTVAWILLACLGALVLRQWWQGKKDRHHQRASANEIEWLEELADEHKRGLRDNREKLNHLLGVFEQRNKDPWLYTGRLDKIRRIIGEG